MGIPTSLHHLSLCVMISYHDISTPPIPDLHQF
jgi:hypothetical protein